MRSERDVAQAYCFSIVNSMLHWANIIKAADYVELLGRLLSVAIGDRSQLDEQRSRLQLSTSQFRSRENINLSVTLSDAGVRPKPMPPSMFIVE